MHGLDDQRGAPSFDDNASRLQTLGHARVNRRDEFSIRRLQRHRRANGCVELMKLFDIAIFTSAMLSPTTSEPLIASPQEHGVEITAHFSKDTPCFSSIGHGHPARGRCCSVSKIVNEIARL
ncbi:MAG: hypothetical protein HYS06_09040 [Methylocystis sp.]|nr:hypothetical protein [Methylocystis sp.]